MFKKFLFAGSVLALSLNVAMANPVPYVGAGIGITTTTTNNVVTSAPFNTNNIILGSSYRGVPVNLFAGYGGTINGNFYLAGELTGTIGNASITSNNTLKTSYSYGASVLPGVMLSDHTLAFGRLGAVETHFSNVDSNRAGAVLGAGLQTSLTQCLDLRGEYDFTAYKKVNEFNFSAKNPRTDAFNVGLVYKIG